MAANNHSSEPRVRLDQLLVERGDFATRSRAADAIRRGGVQVNGKKTEKPGQRVSRTSQLDISDRAQAYVSRAALKLLAALEAFDMDVEGAIAADIGASTGGFTQVLLEYGAARVYAIDVGHDQLAQSLVGDPRVISFEGLNARHLSNDQIPEPLNLIVSDVSFISLKLALPNVLELAAPDAHLIALIKPQFEVGRDGLGKGGIVRDEALHPQVCDDISAWLVEKMKWQVLNLIPSSLTGSDGNKEFLIHARKLGP